MKFFKKARLALGLFAITGGLTVSVVACKDNEKDTVNLLLPGQQIISDDDEFALQTYMANAWSASSAEKMATTLSTFRTAKLLFDAVVNKYQTDIGANTLDLTPKTEMALMQYDAKFSNNSNKQIPAVVVDLDETFLDNTPYQVYNSLNRKSHSNDAWRNWVISGQAFLYPGVVDFVNHVYAKGGVVIFDSDRYQTDTTNNSPDDTVVEGEMKGTMDSLKNFGYPAAFNKRQNYWMRGVERGTDYGGNRTTTLSNPNAIGIAKYLENKYQLSAADAAKQSERKEARFQYINDYTQYQIVMRIGDNLNDFNAFASYNKNNEERRKLVAKDLEELWGQPAKEVRFNPKSGSKINTNNVASPSATREEFSAGIDSYIQIGTNPLYGGWENGMASSVTAYFGLSAAEKSKIREEGMKPTWMPAWNGQANWKEMQNVISNKWELLGLSQPTN